MNMRTASWGAALVLTGVLLLLNTIGVLGWGVWFYLLRLLPLVLVLIGLALILNRNVVPLGLLLLAVIGIAWYLMAGGSIDYPPDRQMVSGTLSVNQVVSPGITKGELDLDFGAGQLQVTAGEPRQLTGQLKYFGPEPVLTYTEDDDTANIRLRPRGEAGITSLRSRIGQNWTLQLPSGIPWELDLDVGAASAELDLTAVQLSEFTLRGGACDVKTVLGAPGLLIKGEAQLGASRLALSIPQGVPVRIRLEGAATGNNLTQTGFSREGNIYTTTDFSPSAPGYDLTIGAGASALEFRWGKAQVML